MNFEFSVLREALPVMLGAVGNTVLLTILAMFFGVFLGIFVALIRVAPSKPISFIALAYVESIRNVPLILLVWWGFYILPIALDLRLSAFMVGLIALTLVVSAYTAETFRAGVNSIRRGQYDAALALGMSKAQMYREVILPQAGRRILPIMASIWVSLFKDTALVSVIGVQELAFVSLELRSTSFRVLEILTAMAVIYWLLGYPQAKFADYLHRKYGAKE